nr:tail length tape measure protein [Klebsiella phage vB_Kpl_K14PH164C1]
MARRGLTIIRCHCCSNCIKSTIEKRHYLTLFQAMQTQWRIGMNGPTGLDYNTLPLLFELYKIDNREAALLDLQILEGEYMKEIYKKSK